MTEKDIIRLAEESQLWVHKDREYAAIERFAALVAAAEREAIAEMVNNCDPRATPKGIAAAIRARGNNAC